MRMITRIHRHAPDRRPDAQPPAPPRLPQLPPIIVAVTRRPHRGARIAMDLPDLSTLQADRNIQILFPPLLFPLPLPLPLRRFHHHHLLPHLIPLLPLHIPRPPNHHRKRPRAPTQLRLSPPPQTHIIHQRPRRDHMQRQTIPAPRRLRRHHPRITAPTQALEQFVRQDPGAERLHRFPRPHPLRRHNVALRPRLRARQQRNVRAPARVVLDPLHRVPPRRVPVEVHDPDPPLVAPAAVPHPDLARVVAPADVLAFAREGEGEVRAARVQVVVDGAAEVAHPGRAGLVGA